MRVATIKGDLSGIAHILNSLVKLKGVEYELNGNSEIVYICTINNLDINSICMHLTTDLKIGKEVFARFNRKRSFEDKKDRFIPHGFIYNGAKFEILQPVDKNLFVENWVHIKKLFI